MPKINEYMLQWLAASYENATSNLPRFREGILDTSFLDENILHSLL
jgi:hypothetical protein